MGFFSGIFLAYYYRNEGPQRPTYSWETEEDFDEKIDSEINENEGEEEKKPSINI